MDNVSRPPDPVIGPRRKPVAKIGTMSVTDIATRYGA